MNIRIRCLLGAAGLGVLVAATPVVAQDMVRVRGVIERIDGTVYVVKSRDGSSLRLILASNAGVAASVKSALSDIKPGSFIGVAALPLPDGSQRALEVHIFPEQMRGTGEGHRSYAPVPNSTMTNGAAAGTTVTGVDGSTMTVKFKGGEKKIVVPPNVPIVRYEIGSKADLKPGAKFTVLAATKKPDGTLEASRINVGRDGVEPQ
jgi:hypothetical protein